MITKRKVVAILLCIVCLFSFATPAFAASGVNPAEMQVLKLMQKGTKYNKDFYQYHNALKVYFNRDTVKISQIYADDACEYLLEIYELYQNEAMNEVKFFEKFQYVLMYLNVRIIYNRADSTADLIGVDGSLVMSNLKLKNVDGKSTISLNPIKQTGAVVNLPLTIGLSVTGAGILVAAAVLAVRKKKGNAEQ
ncbi:MAG: hypothetical protein E7517_03990 [Ruminococcaceae bacterium]|nr:hypothetical protein [Oscillospiraceae bacterium]